MEQHNTNNGWFSEEELNLFKFKNIGKNVLISKKSSIYMPDKISLGSNIRIDDFVIISAKKEIIIGDNVHIGAYSYFSGDEAIIIEDNVGISQGVRIYSTIDDFTGFGLAGPMVDTRFRMLKSGKVILEKYSLIGSGSIVLPDVIIGFNSAIGALSLVNKSIQKNKLALGIPAIEKINRSSRGYKNYEKIIK